MAVFNPLDFGAVKVENWHPAKAGAIALKTPPASSEGQDSGLQLNEALGPFTAQRRGATGTWGDSETPGATGYWDGPTEPVKPGFFGQAASQFGAHQAATGEGMFRAISQAPGSVAKFINKAGKLLEELTPKPPGPSKNITESAEQEAEAFKRTRLMLDEKAGQDPTFAKGIADFADILVKLPTKALGVGALSAFENYARAYDENKGTPEEKNAAAKREAIKSLVSMGVFIGVAGKLGAVAKTGVEKLLPTAAPIARAPLVAAGSAAGNIIADEAIKAAERIAGEEAPAGQTAQSLPVNIGLGLIPGLGALRPREASIPQLSEERRVAAMDRSKWPERTKALEPKGPAVEAIKQELIQDAKKRGIIKGDITERDIFTREGEERVTNSGFIDKETGKYYSTGFFHNIDELPVELQGNLDRLQRAFQTDRGRAILPEEAEELSRIRKQGGGEKRASEEIRHLPEMVEQLGKTGSFTFDPKTGENLAGKPIGFGNVSFEKVIPGSIRESDLRSFMTQHDVMESLRQPGNVITGYKAEDGIHIGIAQTEETGGVEFARRGPRPEINIGLDIGKAGGILDPRVAIQTFRENLKPLGIEIIRSDVLPRTEQAEPTLHMVLSKDPGQEVIDRLSRLTQQEAISVKQEPGKGYVAGPEAQKWGKFNPEYFREPVLRENIDQLSEQWEQNLRKVAPGAAKQIEIEVIRENDLRNRYPSAYVPKDVQAAWFNGNRKVVFLVNEALQSTGEPVHRRNLLHELGHAWFDTLGPIEQDSFEKAWKAETATHTGPLFDANGNLKPTVAQGSVRSLKEWFAESIAHTNDSWAKGRMDFSVNGMFATTASNLRRMAEKVSRIFKPDTPINLIDDYFRKFLDQGGRFRSAPDSWMGVQRQPTPVGLSDDKLRLAMAGATHPKAPGRISQWGHMFADFLKGFKSPVPELPNQPEYAPFREGRRRLLAAHSVARNDAANTIMGVVKPIMDTGVQPERGLIREANLISQKAAEAQQKGKGIPDNLIKQWKTIKDKMDSNPYHLTRLYVLYSDLEQRGSMITGEGEAARTVTLPFGLELGDVQAERQRLASLIDQNPHKDAILSTLKNHYELTEKIKEDLAKRGYPIPEEFQNPAYFPHFLTELPMRAASTRLGTKEPFRSYLINPKGSTKPIETDYFSAMYRHLADLYLHNQYQDIINAYWKPFDKSEVFKQMAKEEAVNENREVRPHDWAYLAKSAGMELYVADPRPPAWMEAIVDRKAISDRVGELVSDVNIRKQIENMGIDIQPSDLRMGLALGEKEVWAVAPEVKAALDGLMRRENERLSQNVVERVTRSSLRTWKWIKLHLPTSSIRYNYGNVTTDLFKLFEVDPKVFSKFPQTIKEVREFGKSGKEPTQDFREGFKRAVTEGVTGKELENLPDLPQFDPVNQKSAVKAVAEWIWHGGANFANAREAVFRLAKFYTDLDRIRSGQEPVYAGANKAEVLGLTDPYDRAAMIARDTFGDYGNISASGELLRRHLVPFYSWRETNFRYHKNLLQNYGDMLWNGRQKDAATGIAKKLLKLPVNAVLPKSATGFLLRAGISMSIINSWNAYVMDRDGIKDTDLSDIDRRRLHLLLGKDPEGKTKLIYLPTAFSDVANYVGGGPFREAFSKWIAGEYDLPQAIQSWTKALPQAVVNQLASDTRPELKLLVGLTGKDVTQDIFDSRPIPKWKLRQFVIGQMIDQPTADLVERLLDKDYYSSRTIGDWGKQLILQVRSRDPQQWNYYDIRDKAEQFVLDKGLKAYEPGRARGEVAERQAELIGNFKRSIFNADLANALRFYDRLQEEGYTAEQFAGSLRGMHPLSGIKQEYRKEFISALSTDDMQRLQDALRYYKRIAGEQAAVPAPGRAVSGRPTPQTETARQLFPRKGHEREFNRRAAEAAIELKINQAMQR